MLEKVLSFYTRSFALWVILGGLAAYLWPGPLACLDRRSVNAVFALTMFGIGAALQTEDFRRIQRRPGIILIGTITQYSLMPLVAYAIAWLFHMDVAQRRSLAIEGGMQNAGLGAVLASEHFSDKAAMPAAVFVFICIITASLLAAYWQRTHPQRLPSLAE